MTATTIGTNWAGNHLYRATALHQPASLDELRTVVARAPKIRALGSRHCFNDIADSAELVVLDRMDQSIAVDPEAGTVTANAGIRYGVLALALQREGWGLHNMASLPHISVVGAIATATHGSGDALGNLATAVAAVELVTSEGDVLHVARGEPDFAGMVVNLGALGVVTRLTLDVQPSYLMRQEVFEHLPWDALDADFDAVMSSADSVSLFLNYAAPDVREVWLKSRVDPANPASLRAGLFGATPATRNLHPIPELDAENCTEQLGVPGAWADRLPHFRMDAVPASGAELQTEYMVPRGQAAAAIRALRGIGSALQPYLWVSEIRSMTGDDLWLSMAYGRDTIGFHFSWKQDPGAVADLLPHLEEALAPFDARPHWGKLFAATAADIAPRYERLPDFRRLADRLDPRGAFRNDFLARHLFG